MGAGAEETHDSDADDGDASISYPPLPVLLIIPFRHDVLDLHLLELAKDMYLRPLVLSYISLAKNS